MSNDVQPGPGLEAGLVQAGYQPERPRPGETVPAALARQDYAALILDLDISDETAVLKTVRQEHDLPVILLTVHNSLEHRVQSLDLGADDYLVKPFRMPELLARLRAVVRRKEGHARSVIVHGDIELDMGARSVRQAGQWIRLTPREYQVLALLMARIGRIVSKDEIEAEVYSAGGEIESNAVEAVVYAIRKKLGRDLIGMVRGVGYVIAS
ncbi:winged helix-turn-helix domain-containing protein [Asticcacaulis solisilvae]|uniref:winged helix-turn-helix domain-containing protein n=1 Tax=Asticcacaulis solisilvae TaxID=1217274 RepID=UPI003FD7C3EC